MTKSLNRIKMENHQIISGKPSFFSSCFLNFKKSRENYDDIWNHKATTNKTPETKQSQNT